MVITDEKLFFLALKSVSILILPDLFGNKSKSKRAAHRLCRTAALATLYPETSASCLCPFVGGSGDGGDGGGLCPAPGPDLIQTGTGSDRPVPGRIPSSRPAAASKRTLSV